MRSISVKKIRNTLSSLQKRKSVFSFVPEKKGREKKVKGRKQKSGKK